MIIKLTNNDINIFKVINKYKVVTLKHIVKITKMHKTSCSRRLKQLCNENYIQSHNYINNVLVYTITKKSIKLLDVKSSSNRFNPLNAAITNHELKVLDIAIYFSEKLDINVVDMFVNRDLTNRYIRVSGVVDLAFHHNGKHIGVEVERTPKSIERTKDKIINTLVRDYDHIIFIIGSNHYRIIDELLNLNFLYDKIQVRDYETYEHIGGSVGGIHDSC